MSSLLLMGCGREKITAPPPPGGYAFVANVAVHGNNPTTSAINTTGANLIVVVCTGFGSDTFFDSNGNTWTNVTSDVTAGGVQLAAYYCYAPTVGAGHTFSVTAQVYAFVGVAAFSGAAASPFDQFSSASNAGPVTGIQAGSITPTQAGELVVAYVGLDGGSTPPTAAGYTTTDSIYNDGVSEGGGLAYLIQTSAAATNPTWSWSGGCAAAAIIASFK